MQRNFDSNMGRQRAFEAQSTQDMQLRQIEEASTTLVRFGRDVVRKNPRKVALWVVGLCLCMFFNGFEVSHGAYEKHRMLHDSIDYDKLWNAEDAMHTARRQYDRLRGWFWSCNQNCQVAKMEYESKMRDWKLLDDNRVQVMRSANSEVGLLSVDGRFLHGYICTTEE